MLNNLQRSTTIATTLAGTSDRLGKLSAALALLPMPTLVVSDLVDSRDTRIQDSAFLPTYHTVRMYQRLARGIINPNRKSSIRR